RAYAADPGEIRRWRAVRDGSTLLHTIISGGGSAMRAAGICAMMILAAALASGAHAQVSDDAVRIGVLTDMSGPYQDWAGTGSVDAARMAVEEFGGTVLGKKIEIFSADHQNKADVGANLVRQWFDTNGVDMVIGVP